MTCLIAPLRKVADSSDHARGSRPIRLQGRLSQNLEAYGVEVNRLLSEPERRTRERVSAAFQSCRTEQELVASGFVTTIAYYSYPVESWLLTRSAGTKFNFAHQV